MAPDNPGFSGTSTVELPTGRIRGMLARGEAKAALNRAKELYKTVRTAECESLLVDCYLARATELQARRLPREAEAVLKIVHERWPDRLPQLEQVQTELAAREGRLEPLLERLQNDGLPSEERNGLETLLRHHLSDLRVLASLPVGHPLRTDAMQLQRAFEIVTSGPVKRADVPLPEVPRRSPLAPWRLLVLALVAFYERADAECEKCLQAIDSQSPPARLVAPLRSVMAGVEGGNALSAQLRSDNRGACRRAFRILDDLLVRGQGQKVLASIPEAIRQALAYCPGQVDALRQRLSVRCVGLHLPPDRVLASLGSPSLKDAVFWRLLAQQTERMEEGRLYACAAWHEFGVHARHQGLFKRPSDTAVLYVHMASLLRPLGEMLKPMRTAFMRTFAGFQAFYTDQPPSVMEALQSPASLSPADYLDPDVLFARAAKLDPHVSVFQPWFAWAQRMGGATEVAERWHAALPTDLPPLLHLAEAAEERGALTKAEAYLASAEALNALHPLVRAARIRVHLNTLKRHAKKRQYHLCEKDVERLRVFPSLQDSDARTFVAALYWVQGLAQERKLSPEAVANKLGPVGAGLLLQAVSKDLYGMSQPVLLETGASTPATVALGLAKASQLASRFGLRLHISKEMAKAVEEHLAGEACTLGFPQREAIAQQAVWAEHLALLHAATGSGLSGDPVQQGRCLLLRARSLPAGQRQWQCLLAAAELARRSRDEETLQGAADLAQRSRDAAPLTLEEAELQQVLAFEQQASANSQPGSVRHAAPEELPAGLGFDLDDLFEDFPELNNLSPDVLGSMLESVARMLEGRSPGKRRSRR
ncbi:MAG TPA: hypothetical protein VGO93_19410 [Candidatus Xenobia bacterium]|jgi:hypothetical protein